MTTGEAKVFLDDLFGTIEDATSSPIADEILKSVNKLVDEPLVLQAVVDLLTKAGL